MATAPPSLAEDRLIPVEQYLASAYEHDCEYLDGHLEERPFGEYEHSRIQTMLAHLFFSHESAWRIRAVVECRVQVGPTRFRIPDIALIAEDKPVSRIIRTPPLLCIEILSPEDTWTRLRTRTADYFTMGVQNVWVFDPDSREAFTSDPAGFYLAPGPTLSIPSTPIQVTLAEVFAALPPRP